MEKYIDNYGNEIEADYQIELPVSNAKQDMQIEELWRRLSKAKSAMTSSRAKIMLQGLMTDIEYWMEENPIESPKRWE